MKKEGFFPTKKEEILGDMPFQCFYKKNKSSDYFLHCLWHLGYLLGKYTGFWYNREHIGHLIWGEETNRGWWPEILNSTGKS